ncbi:MAG: hypothetical protein MR051_05285 [Lentisphaeria bacterium]|nr:hypothetical protein [Lentisphaeria bacterium]
MKKCKVYEQVKSEISPERTKAILNELEDEFRRVADRVEIDDGDGEIRIEGVKTALCQASGILRLDEKKGKYLLEGELDGKASMTFWGLFSATSILYIIGWTDIALLFFLGIIADAVLFFMFFSGVKKIGKALGDRFRSVVKES